MSFGSKTLDFTSEGVWSLWMLINALIIILRLSFIYLFYRIQKKVFGSGSVQFDLWFIKVYCQALLQLQLNWAGLPILSLYKTHRWRCQSFSTVWTWLDLTYYLFYIIVTTQDTTWYHIKLKFVPRHIILLIFILWVCINLSSLCIRVSSTVS